MYWNRMLNLYFYFLYIFPKIHSFEKSDKNKSFGERAKPTNYLICFWLSCVIVKISYENCQN